MVRYDQHHSPCRLTRQNFEIRSWSAAVTVAMSATGAAAMATTGVNQPRVFKMPLPFSIWKQNSNCIYANSTVSPLLCPLRVRANASQHQTPLHQTPMPARRKQLVAEEPCGSSQSAASLAADKAAQPRLFAAAAARRGAGHGQKPKGRTPGHAGRFLGSSRGASPTSSLASVLN